MTTVIFSNVSDPRQGGGLPYVLAIAAALSEDRVQVLFPANLSLDLARQLFPVPLDGLSLESDSRPSSLLREVGVCATQPCRTSRTAAEEPRQRFRRGRR